MKAERSFYIEKQPKKNAMKTKSPTAFFKFCRNVLFVTSIIYFDSFGFVIFCKTVGIY